MIYNLNFVLGMVFQLSSIEVEGDHPVRYQRKMWLLKRKSSWKWLRMIGDIIGLISHKPFTGEWNHEDDGRWSEVDKETKKEAMSRTTHLSIWASVTFFAVANVIALTISLKKLTDSNFKCMNYSIGSTQEFTLSYISVIYVNMSKCLNIALYL